jgi:multidrug efflux system membrane fusion protein
MSNHSFLFVRGWLFLFALLAALMCFSLTGCSKKDAVEAPKTVLVTLARAPIDPASVIVGTVRAAAAHDVSAQNGGRVEKLLVDVGAPVRAGQILAILENRAETLKLNLALADARRSQAQAVERQHNFQRMEALLRADAISKSAYEAAKADALVASNAAVAAREAEALAKRDLDLTIIRSPCDGIVAARQARLSDVVAAGTVLFEVDGRGPREIVAAAPDREAQKLSVGMKLQLRTASGEGTGVITEIGQRLSGSGSRDIRMQIVSEDIALGSVVEVVLATGTDASASALVPPTAIVEPVGMPKSVFVVTSDNRLARIAVSLRAIGSAGALVDGAMKPGDRVVIAGGSFLTPGMAVKPVLATR